MRKLALLAFLAVCVLIAEGCSAGAEKPAVRSILAAQESLPALPIEEQKNPIPAVAEPTATVVSRGAAAAAAAPVIARTSTAITDALTIKNPSADSSGVTIYSVQNAPYYSYNGMYSIRVLISRKEGIEIMGPPIMAPVDIDKIYYLDGPKIEFFKEENRWSKSAYYKITMNPHLVLRAKLGQDYQLVSLAEVSLQKTQGMLKSKFVFLTNQGAGTAGITISNMVVDGKLGTEGIAVIETIEMGLVRRAGVVIPQRK